MGKGFFFFSFRLEREGCLSPLSTRIIRELKASKVSKISTYRHPPMIRRHAPRMHHLFMRNQRLAVLLQLFHHHREIEVFQQVQRTAHFAYWEGDVARFDSVFGGGGVDDVVVVVVVGKGEV